MRAFRDPSLSLIVHVHTVTIVVHLHTRTVVRHLHCPTLVRDDERSKISLSLEWSKTLESKMASSHESYVINQYSLGMEIFSIKLNIASYTLIAREPSTRHPSWSTCNHLTLWVQITSNTLWVPYWVNKSGQLISVELHLASSSIFCENL